MAHPEQEFEREDVIDPTPCTREDLWEMISPAVEDDKEYKERTERNVSLLANNDVARRIFERRLSSEQKEKLEEIINNYRIKFQA